LILRVFAVERFIRFVVFAAAAYRVRRFKYFAMVATRISTSANVHP